MAGTLRSIFSTLLRRRLQNGKFAIRHPFAAHLEFPLAANPRERGEVLLVPDFQDSGPGIEADHFDRLGEIFEFVNPRVWRAVGPDEPVTDEVQVVRFVTEVAAVCPIFLALFGLLL